MLIFFLFQFGWQKKGILVEWLRLKGFNDKSNKNFNKINDFSKLDEYLEKNCAYGCKYFVLKKLVEK